MQKQASKTPFYLSLFLNLILLLSAFYLFFVHQAQPQKTTLPTVPLENKIKGISSSLQNIQIEYNLMQDQYTHNIDEIHSIVAIKELSKQFGYLSLKEREKQKIERLIAQTTEWMEKKSAFSVYIKPMNEQLKILLFNLKTHPSFESITDIQNTISDIVAVMLERSLVQTKRFYKLTEEIEKNIQNTETLLR